MTDKELFCEQIRQLERSMYSLAFSIVKNEADALEILSEAVFRAYKNLDTLRSQKAFKAWVLRIVHNTAVEYVRKNTGSLPLEAAEAIDEGYKDPAVSLSLREAVRQLGPPYRTVILLYYYEDLSAAQISVITGSTVVAVKQRLSRARKQLRELLKEDFENE